ncbi:MAG: hypothetical protein R3B70_07510 [Polyangiaceae bacterium]
MSEDRAPRLDDGGDSGDAEIVEGGVHFLAGGEGGVGGGARLLEAGDEALELGALGRVGLGLGGGCPVGDLLATDSFCIRVGGAGGAEEPVAVSLAESLGVAEGVAAVAAGDEAAKEAAKSWVVLAIDALARDADEMGELVIEGGDDAVRVTGVVVEAVEVVDGRLAGRVGAADTPAVEGGIGDDEDAAACVVRAAVADEGARAEARVAGAEIEEDAARVGLLEVLDGEEHQGALDEAAPVWLGVRQGVLELVRCPRVAARGVEDEALGGAFGLLDPAAGDGDLLDDLAARGDSGAGGGGVWEGV